MTPKNLLDVFVRLAGLAFIQLGLFDLYYVVVKTFGIQTESQVPVWRDIRGFMLYCGWGIVLILAAKLIVRVTFWQERQD